MTEPLHKWIHNRSDCMYKTCPRANQTKSQRDWGGVHKILPVAEKLLANDGCWGRERVTFLQGGGLGIITYVPVDSLGIHIQQVDSVGLIKVYMTLGGKGRLIWLKLSNNNVKREVRKMFFLLWLLIKSDSEMIMRIELLSDLLCLLFHSQGLTQLQEQCEHSIKSGNFL